MIGHLHIFEFNDSSERSFQGFHVDQAISQVLEFTITIPLAIPAIRANDTIHLITSLRSSNRSSDRLYIAFYMLFMPFAELVDISKEIERLEKEEKRLQGELARVNGMLSNERFISKAPAAKIAEEQAKKEKYQQMMEQVQERLSQLR